MLPFISTSKKDIGTVPASQNYQIEQINSRVCTRWAFYKSYSLVYYYKEFGPFFFFSYLGNKNAEFDGSDEVVPVCWALLLF